MLDFKDSPPLSEDLLVGGSVAGDRSSYARLYEMHKSTLIERASEELCNGDDAEATVLIQEAFSDVFTTIQHIDRTIPFADSIMDAARDRAVSQSTERLSTLSDFTSFAERILRTESSPDADPMEILAARESVEESVSALRTLFALRKAGDQKMDKGLTHVFELLQGKTIDEIAKREKITPAKVLSRVESARASLQQILRPL